MSPPRFVHKRITAAEFNAELDRQNLSLPSFTRIWCQNITKVTKWSEGKEDIPTWVPIALTLMTLPDAVRTGRIAAAAMIEKDTLAPHLGQFPYRDVGQMPESESEVRTGVPEQLSDAGGSNLEMLTPDQHRAKHRDPDRG